MQQGPAKQPSSGIKVVIAALAMALVAVIILSIYIQGVKDQVAAKQFTVFVLNENVSRNDPIKRKDWESYKIPDTPEFDAAFRKGIKAVMSEDELIVKVKAGDRYEVDAARGSIITHVMFDKENRSKELEVEAGKVRIALPVQSKTTPGGLRPGDFVNIAAPIETGGAVPEMMVVMEIVKIKAIGTQTYTEGGSDSDRKIRNYSTVSIDVDQATAVKLSTLEKMVRAIGEFELFITSQKQKISWQGGGINPDVLKHMEKMLPRRTGS